MWLNYLKICMQNISAQFVVNETEFFNLIKHNYGLKVFALGIFWYF